MSKKNTPPLVKIDAVMDIFGRPAGWMLYWGNTSIFIFFALLLGLAAWISYPDEVEVEVQISTSHPPAQLVASINGIISDVFFEEGESVMAGQNILLLDNTAKKEDIEVLDFKLTQIQALKQATDIFNLELNEHLDLGELGAAYVTLINQNTTLKYWLERSQQGKSAKRLSLQLSQRKEQKQHLSEQLKQLQEEKSIAQRNAQQYAELLEKGAASQLEVDHAFARLLQTQRQLEAQKNQIIQNQIQTESLELEKIDLSEQFSDQITEQWLAFKHQQRKLRQALNSWEDRYMLKAKTAGTITFFQSTSNGQYLQAGQLLGNIVPTHTDSLSLIAEGYLSSQAIGRIKSGQPVFIELNAYPYREFGQIKGFVSELSPTPAGQNNDLQSGYRILIQLPQRLLSTYGNELFFRQHLKGKASIITEDRSLLDRLLDRFKDLL